MEGIGIHYTSGAEFVVAVKGSVEHTKARVTIIHFELPETLACIPNGFWKSASNFFLEAGKVLS